MRLLLIDNYDSYTYNLYQMFLKLNVDVTVRKNDEWPADDWRGLIGGFDAVVISPGPGSPTNDSVILGRN